MITMTSLINPRAILIDLDGTLADSLSVMRTAYEHFLQQFNIKPTDAEFNALNGPPLDEVVRRLKKSHALCDDEHLLHDNYFALIDELYTRVKPNIGAEELLLAAKINHCAVGVVTSNSMLRTQRWLETVGLSSFINFIISGDDVKNGKPDPEPYRIATHRSACPSTQIIAIEDSPQGATSALGAGLITYVLVQNETDHGAWPAHARPITSLASLIGLCWEKC